MDERQLFQTVARLSGISVEEATDLTRATLQTLAYRLSGGEVRRLAEQVPEGLREYVPQPSRVDRFGFDELVRRVSKRVRLNIHETEIGVRAVLRTLSESVNSFDRVLAQLPIEFRPS
jgi:uncharacterized protein (DUF2267 family)